jgi:glycosyltransferase involved in cell wall biosynthesis
VGPAAAATTAAMERGLVVQLRSSNSLGFGGMEAHSEALARRIAARGDRWTVQTIDAALVPDGLPPRRSLPQRTVVLVESWRWSDLTPAVRSHWPDVPIVVRSGGNDVHHAIARAQDVLGVTNRVPTYRYRTWVRAVTGSVDLIVANSRYSAARLAESDLGAIRSAVITGGASAPDRERPAGGNAVPVVAVVGRFIAWKGLDDCITAAAIAQRDADLELILIGDGALRGQLEDLASERLRPGTWRFTGALRHDECLATLAGADVLLSMSRLQREREGRHFYIHTETMGRAICEALVAGVPVVATGVGGVPELIDASTGTLVAEGDVGAAAEAVLAWARRGAIAPAAVALLRRRLGWEAVLDGYLDLFDELAAAVPGPS